MTAPGILTILAGSGDGVPLPLDAATARAIKSIELQERFDGQGGFRIVLGAARGAADYDLMAEGPLQPNDRVIFLFTWGGLPIPLIDGIVTRRWLAPSITTDSEIFIDGADLSVLMDKDEVSASFEGMADEIIVNEILAAYAGHGIVPTVVPPPAVDPRVGDLRTAMQNSTDLDHLHRLADRCGYAFGLRAGPVAGTSQAYWGPIAVTGETRPALTAAMGFLSNLQSISVEHDPLAAISMTGLVQDAASDEDTPVEAVGPDLAPLALEPSSPATGRKRLLPALGGYSEQQAMAFAQGRVDAAAMRTMRVSGTLDTAVFGDVLRAGDRAQLRGAGTVADGDYLVWEVTHAMAQGGYTQRFALRRDGVGPLSSMVMP
jgi:hypothetical protein